MYCILCEKDDHDTKKCGEYTRFEDLPDELKLMVKSFLETRWPALMRLTSTGDDIKELCEMAYSIGWVKGVIEG